MTRVKVVLGLFCLAFFIIWVRLFYWQIIQRETLASSALTQYFSEYSIFPKRGRIFTKDLFPLVANETAFLVYAEPKKLPENREFIKNLSTILEIEEASITASIDKDKSWVALKHKISNEKKKAIEKLKINGIGFDKESVRFYPEGSSSAQLLGFVGQDVGGNPTGYFGLEGYYNEFLSGKPGFVQQEKDALGIPIPIGKQNRVESINGSDLILAIDRSVQQIIEKNLRKGIERFGAKSGSVIIMEPYSGAILGIDSLPAYDPSTFIEFDASLYKNPVIADSYEPGSTFKIIVMAAAINEKAVKPSDTFDETGPVEVQGYKIKTWDDQYHGKTTMTQVLERSSNVGMVFISEKLGRDNFYNYLEQFGFGKKTGIDLQEEIAAPLREKEEWKKIDLATASFGQGIAVTPIQLIRAAVAIANGGELVIPKVVSYIQADNKKKINLEETLPVRVLQPMTSSILSEMMVAAVDNGEAKWAKPKNFRIAGKTGTAQIPISGHYDPEKTIASFIGFVPAEKPKFVMLVLLREPTSSPWGSETAAPLFFDIARDLLAYFGIAPD